MGNGLGNIEDYANIYSYVVKGSKTSDQLKDYLVKQKGVLKKTADSQIKKIKEGNFAFLDYADEKISFNYEAFLAALDGMGRLLNYNITAEPVKKKKPEDEIAVITSGHSKNYRNERTRANGLETANKKLEAEFNQMQKELKSLAALQITTCMDKKVVALQSVKSEPTEALEEDGFLAMSDASLASGESKSWGTLAGIYEADTSSENELSESNYIKRICNFFKHSKFFEKRCQVNSNKNRENEPVKAIDKGREEIVNQLLNNNIPNQAKLATYALWYFHDDLEMEHLLKLAGQYGINANYVIQLLENPNGQMNYKTVRAFLQQAMSSSEVRIKKEAAQELLCGDWVVVADYCGKPCHFKLMPVEELAEFRKILETYDLADASELLKKLTETKTTCGPTDHKLENRSVQKEDIEAPEFIHEVEQVEDVHAPIDEEATFEHFAEQEDTDE